MFDHGDHDLGNAALLNAGPVEIYADVPIRGEPFGSASRVAA